MLTKEMLDDEWEVAIKYGAIYAVTQGNYYCPSAYKKNGTLKKNAERAHRVLFRVLPNPPLSTSEEAIDRANQICLHHNLLVNHDNPKRQKEIITEVIESTMSKIFGYDISFGNAKRMRPLPHSKLCLSNRARKALLLLDIETIHELKSLDLRRLRALKNCGETTVRELKRKQDDVIENNL